MQVLTQVPQQLEPEATTKSSNHISHSSFFPFFARKYIKQKYTNTGATTQRLPLALPNPPCLHMHLRTRPFRHPAARACHNTWERESRRKQIADGGAHFSMKAVIRVKWVGAPVLQKASVLRGAMARTAARSKCHLHDSRATSGRAKQRTKNQLEQAGFLLSEMNSS